MTPYPRDRGHEVEQIAGRNALSPNVRLELQDLIDQLRSNCRAHGHEVLNAKRDHESQTSMLRNNLRDSNRKITELRARLDSTERERKLLEEKLDSDGLHSLYQAGAKVIESQAAQIKELRGMVLHAKEEREKLEITPGLRIKEKDAVIAEYQDVQQIARLKAQNAELASTSKAHKMLNDELDKKITIVQKHFDNRKSVMEDQEKLIKRYQKQLKDAEKAQGP